MPLKAVEIGAFRAGEKSYKKADAKGLYLEVFPNGSKLWRVKYRIAGKEKRLALGAWPDISLAKARDLNEEARRKLADGIDPALERKKAKVAAKITLPLVHPLGKPFVSESSGPRPSKLKAKLGASTPLIPTSG